MFIEDAGPFTELDAGEAGPAAKKALGRVGRAADVVRAFLYLLDFPFVTGFVLYANGGAFMIKEETCASGRDPALRDPL